MVKQDTTLADLGKVLGSDPAYMTQLKTARYKKDFNLFVQDAWEIIEPGVPYSHNWHIDYITEEVFSLLRGSLEGVFPDSATYPNPNWDEADKSPKKLIINVPTRSMKTLLVSVFIPIWLLIHNPSLKFATGSYAEDIAIDINVKRRQILTSKWFQDHFGHIVTLNDSDHTAKTMIETAQKGLLFTFSIGGKFTGRGADIIILDDPQKPAEMDSKAERDKAIRFLQDTLPTRFNNQNTGVLIIIQQRLHPEDLTGYITKNMGDIYRKIDIQLQFEEDRVYKGTLTGREWKVKKGEPLWAARVDSKSIESLRRNLGSRNFQAQQQQRPTPEGSAIVKRSWFDLARYDGTPDEWIARTRKYQPEYFKSLKLIISVDANYATGEVVESKKDPVGVAVIAVDTETETFFVLSVKEYDWSFGTTLVRLADMREDYIRQGFSVPTVLIEKKANGGPVIEILKKNISGVVGFEPGMADKIARLKASTPPMESQNVRLPTDNADVPWLEPFFAQLLGFPFTDHDDMVDSLSQAILYQLSSKAQNNYDINIYF